MASNSRLENNVHKLVILCVNEIREMCFIIPDLCGRRYRFSQFDLKS